MAYTAIYANGSTFNMVKKFVIDSFNEIYDIDKSQLSPGSTAFDISSSKTYMLNNKKQWIEVQVGTGGGSGGGGGGGADVLGGRGGPGSAPGGPNQPEHHRPHRRIVSPGGGDRPGGPEPKAPHSGRRPQAVGAGHGH